MKQEEINKKIKTWKIVLFITTIPIIIFLIIALWRAIDGSVCIGFSCYKGIEGFLNYLVSFIFLSILLVVPIILEILDIIFLIVSIIKIKKYKKLLN